MQLLSLRFRFIMQRKWRVLIVVCVGVFMASLDLFIVNIAFPDIARDLGERDLGSLSWVLNAYAIVFAALLVPAGRWADAFGRRRAFLTGLVVFAGASAACAAAPSVGVLVGARIVQAAGAALLLPTSLGLLLPEFPAWQRHVAIGVWAAVGGVAAATGPPLGGVLVEAGWRWVFLVNLPVAAIALVVALRTLREVRDPGAARPDAGGAALVIAAVGALVVAIVKGPDWGWGSASVVGLLAAAVVLAGAVGRRIATHPAPVVEPAILRVRAFSLAVLSSVLFYVAFAAMLLATVLFLTDVWDESALRAGLMIAPGPAAAALFAVPGARLGARVGHRVAGALGALVFGLGAVWWSTHLGDAHAYAADFLPGMLIGGVGVGLVNPALMGAAAAALPPARFATGAAVVTMGRQIGSALGVALLVAILGTVHAAADFDGAWTLMMIGAGASAVVLAALGPAPVREPGPVLAEVAA
jgi:EmrB/QacA subfamily drug resistance transporter